MFVGFPIIRAILHVFAATNSAIRYGNGLILALFAKKQINGVNVRIIISFEVNTVSTDTVTYRKTNNFF
jgi:hypothetical protein